MNIPKARKLTTSLGNLTVKNALPDVQREAPAFESLASDTVTGHHRDHPGSILSVPSLWAHINVRIYTRVRSPPESSLLPIHQALHNWDFKQSPGINLDKNTAELLLNVNIPGISPASPTIPPLSQVMMGRCFLSTDRSSAPADTLT